MRFCPVKMQTALDLSLVCHWDFNRAMASFLRAVSDEGQMTEHL